MMTKDNELTLAEVVLSNINYAFFTNEAGHSDAGYLLDGCKTRNVNLYSPAQETGKGFDSATHVLNNINACFRELALGNEVKHKFFMTSNYAQGGMPLIISCEHGDGLNELNKRANHYLLHDDAPASLKLVPSMRDAVTKAGISVIKADSLIFKGIEGESIAVLGASGDAHPIMMFDDESKIACYISGAHAALKHGVLEKSFDEMVRLGANPMAIRLVIGPGLGAKSYEFGNNAPDYFGILDETQEKVFKAVTDAAGEPRYLVNIKQLVCAKLINQLPAEAIFDIELDTMGFDLYEEKDTGLTRKTSMDFHELNQAGLLFFGARREIMQKSDSLMEHNSAAYSTVGRHAAGFFVPPTGQSSVHPNDMIKCSI